MTKDEALKLALEALEIVKLQYTQNRHVNEAITAIKEALAQPVQEPDLTAVYMSGLYDGKKKREWVGLTDDEVNAAWGTVAWNSSKGLTELRYEYARNIETKIKEKNT